MSDTQARGRRTGGREGRRAARLAEVAERVPFITRQLQPVEILSEEGLATIEQNADTILETVGIEFRGMPDALELLKNAGCEIEEVVRSVDKIETATEPRFQEHFVGAMGIPHATDPYPRLAEHVRLPERTATATGRRRRATRERSAP